MLVNLKNEAERSSIFNGFKFGICLPGTWESYMFLSTLSDLGAEIWFYPMFCKSDVKIELLKKSIKIIKPNNLQKQIETSDFLYDSTAFLGKNVVSRDTSVKGIIEQTASGTKIYSEYSEKGLLKQPVFNLDAAFVKKIGENQMATGLGLIEALLKLHLFLPSKYVLILGFGNVGKGCASFLHRLGCEVGIYDIDSNRISEARNLGYETENLEQTLPKTDIIVNATGSFTPVLDAKQFDKLKCGVILVNMGGVGWDRVYFENKLKEEVGPWLDKIFMDDSKFFYEMAKGLPVNFIFASGTDTETMDTVFSLSVLALEYLVKNYNSLPNVLQPIPEEVQQKHLKFVSRTTARKDLIKLMESC
jgi:adenosylhomocysteinase